MLNDTPLLDSLQTPADLRRIPADRLPELAAEIRREMLAVVSQTGGHLASNLGMVELTIALLRTFDLEKDQFVWDTGHQSYVYKLLTGRRELFQKLRQDDGCCGFLQREESRYDVFGAGHAGTAISAALGVAAARDRLGGKGQVVAVVGDGALGCGVSLEGLNSIIETTDDFILVLNDNKMSIAPNVGAISRCLNRIISGRSYNRFKMSLKSLVLRIPFVGRHLRSGIRSLEEATKSMLVPGVLFEELGLRYIGPLDGHDIPDLLKTLAAVRRLQPQRKPIVLHVLTEKGHGYPYAEQEPEVFHGTSKFDLQTGKATGKKASGEQSLSVSFSQSLGTSLEKMMACDKQVVAVTAGMCQGTGLQGIKEKYPDRFFDVGIAEEHAVVFAAGMATAGFKPVVAIYATFMQRAMDYVFHDVCLQNLPVIFCLDRAGAVSDGPTHHGIHDLAFWRSVPGLCVLQPADSLEQEQMLAMLLERGQPAILRYPRGAGANLPVPKRPPLVWGRAAILREGRDVAIWGLGREALTALQVAECLASQGIQACVVNPRFVNPMDAELLRLQAGRLPLVVLEDHCVEGGFASSVAEALAGMDGVRLLKRGWPREIVPWGSQEGLRRKFGLTVSQLTGEIADFVGQGVVAPGSLSEKG
jgi:1-deoxy-D-xylulose-5-phosphate synthase